MVHEKLLIVHLKEINLIGELHNVCKIFLVVSLKSILNSMKFTRHKLLDYVKTLNLFYFWVIVCLIKFSLHILLTATNII